MKIKKAKKTRSIEISSNKTRAFSADDLAEILIEKGIILEEDLEE